MLSYQHSYHAGNFADVHKHVALVMLLRRLQEKAAPICYVDCHAGRGLYDLQGIEARKNREYDEGILRLTGARDLHSALRDYLDRVASFNSGDDLSRYPGSAALAQSVLRDQDRAMLLEFHPQEHAALKAFAGRDRRLSVHFRDCYEGLPALLPPVIRRGLVSIDPSYEVKREFEAVAGLLSAALARWPNAVYLVWYPVLDAGRHRELLDRIRDSAPPKTLHSEWRIDAGARGLRGSGLVIVNTPWQFESLFGHAFTQVPQTLQPNGRSVHTLHWLTEP